MSFFDFKTLCPYEAGIFGKEPLGFIKCPGNVTFAKIVHCLFMLMCPIAGKGWQRRHLSYCLSSSKFKGQFIQLYLCSKLSVYF